MVRYYTLISVFPESGKTLPRVDIKLIDVSLYNLSRKMTQLAIKYVCDEVGKNKFVNTLEGDYKALPVEKCPPGFVLKEPAKDCAMYGHGQIDIWMNQCVSGLLSSYNVAKIVGTFAIIPAESTSKAVEKDFKSVVEELKKRAKTAQAQSALEVSCVPMDDDEEEEEEPVDSDSDSEESNVENVPVESS
jgi:hypothetical protein